MMAPEISVIVPVLDDVCGVEGTVGSLVAQSSPHPAYEVIVVDNGSTDGTLEAAGRLAVRYPGVVRVAREVRMRGSYAARNEGIRRARGEVLCFIDADMIAPPDYLWSVAEVFASEVDYVGCRVEVVVERATAAALFNRASGFPVREYLERQHFTPTAALCVRRRVVEAVGAFDARLESGGDVEFGQRVHAAGFRQAYAGHIVLRHRARSSFRALLAKQRRVARGAAQLAYYHPERYRTVTRRFRSPRFYLPSRPGWLAGRLGEAGVRVSWLTAAGIALRMAPLHWVEPLVHVRETRRLRAQERARAGA